ncbi:aminotransferase class I/II-fold pyridoxal phosphate-dependent enzyme [Sphingomonas cannabina]|uniref:aminotransferase class I/II-fold pyridoxal phosphate-dependent enzyme n=1 Tax=Sphingomonas cannabina TaxID=2899123 RepID=UPI001F309D76|nr:aminotransferase class I/II-fold pyridoxal phosphate-dependent enzyme [Sphingomonas cannabina]UIJ47353.1 aminotransferase class I/II-fold pyridoxal phosphate-dependent enzyme [Sphingomonas cannabina]
MVAEIEPFHAMAMSRRAHQLAAEGRSIVHMEYGEPSAGAPARAIAVAHERLDNDALGYWESTRLKERIALHYREDHGVAVEPEQILLTAGASPALVLALLSLFRPGARVAFARPGYVAYRNTLKALYLEPLELGCGPAERFQLTAAAIERIDPAPDGLVIASPANPTGTIIDPAELSAIVDVCRRRGIRIVSDEIYQELSFVGSLRSVLAEAPDALIVNSFSKYYGMPGWRLGWLVVPPELIPIARARMSNLFLAPSTLAQHAALAAFDCREELDARVAGYRRNRDLLLEALADIGLDRLAPADGAFYVYADVGRWTGDSLAFCTRLLDETGVATAPGIDFDPVEGHRFMRFSFALSTEQVQEAIARLAPWFRTQPMRGAVSPAGALI